MRLHRFTDTGVQRFELYLDNLKVDPSAAPPVDLLTDVDCSLPVAPNVEVAVREFGSRMDLAKYLDGILTQVTGCDVQRDAGLWAWLTLFFFDQVCPGDGHGRRKVGQRARYVPAFSDYQKYYRHLLASPYRVFRAHRDDPDRALVVLCGPVHQPGELVEQLLSRQEIVTNPNALAAATSTYYDPNTGSFKRGAAGAGKGSARRFPDVLNQFDVTWDLYAMPDADILKMLPKEFDRFRAREA